MLQIKGISKVYKTGSLVQQALDHVSLNLRESEFVAILGQSGSGKTTLLNIIGGLDRYDEGDLIINGVSTKKYSDRDWDSYRNHTVGFVFQSYNLIPHQTILANVELALTIGGISRRDRTRRAAEALRKVGLEEHIHKRPSQLSGGQMQRVAIARALVNDPSVVLADEPTGALDSETGKQVMELLREVAKDRLVVMVTHNPELAERYATRIVNLRDGVILSDSDPFEPEPSAPAVHRNMGRASMSFLTALSLSFNNLRTKMARTILVSFAGSIGIIGIAMILSLSTGVDRYIQSVEEETLQGYPLQITDTSFDLANFTPPDEKTPEEQEQEEKEEKDVREWKTVTNMFSRVSTNDLRSLKAFLDSGDSGMEPYVRAIEYDYNLAPQIYALRDGTVRQVNPDRSFAAMGFSATDGMNGLLSSFSSTDTFHPMPEDESLYRSQYEVKAGRWPEHYNECVLVLTSGGRVTDLTLYTLGLKDPKQLDEMVKTFVEGGSTETDEEEAQYDYEEFLGIEFRLISSADLYVYDTQYKVWTDKSGDKTFVRDLVEHGETITVVGVVQPLEDSATAILSTGLGYPYSLTRHIMETAEDSGIVQAQLSAPEINVFTDQEFGAPEKQEDMDMSTLFSVDEDAMENAFQFDTEGMEVDVEDLDFSAMDMENLDLEEVIGSGSFDSVLPSISEEDVASLLSSVNIQITEENVRTLFDGILNGYLAWSAQDPSTDYLRLPESVEAYLQTEELRDLVVADVQAIIQENGGAIITQETLQGVISEVMAGYPAYLEANTPEPVVVENEDGTTTTIPQEPTVGVEDYLQTPEAQAILTQAAADMLADLGALSITEEQRDRILNDILAGYQSYAAENDLPDPTLLGESFSEYMGTPEAGSIIAAGVSSAIDTSELESQVSSMLTSYSSALGGALSSMMEQIVTALTDAMTTAMTDSLEQLMTTLTENFEDAFQIDFDAIAGAIYMNMDEGELRDLLMSLMPGEETSYESNLRKLGYADPLIPTSITIYPIDFEGKSRVKAILNGYNDAKRAAGEEEKIITYTDVVDTLMSSVTDIINAISYVLIAFVAISLVVSSIMIGVITYISVLERNKEIGILRAIGASKRNISEVFNAETFIIGALAGVFGIVITSLLLIPANHIIHSLTEQDISAVLPVTAAGILILLSIVLTLIGGIIPSRKAARCDPVAALRSE